jgi:threonine/homoserine/homoserine lactone efflux protein
VLSSLAAFLAISVVVICTPGQDTALTIRNTLSGGRRSGIATAAGVALGQAIWTLAASTGLAGLTLARAARQGVLSNLGNPKMAVFFASLLPQFAPAGRASFLALLALGLLFCSMTFAWLTLYAVALARARQFLAGRIRRALDAVTGIVLVLFGIRLAAER